MPRKTHIPTLYDTFDLFKQSLGRIVVNPTLNSYKPMPIQEKFHNSKAKGKVFLGGNRAGKTVAGGAETVMYLEGRHPNQVKKPPVHWRGIASSIEEGLNKIMIPEIKKWISPSLLKNGSWDDSFDKQSRTLTLENNSTLEFLTYEQDVQKHAGTSRDGVWFDEEPPEDIFDENMMRILDTDGVWILTMTPLIDMSWTYDRLYVEGSKETFAGIEVFHADTEDNIYINKEALDVLQTGMSEEQKKARRSGTYFNLSGGIFSGSLSKENIIDPIIGSNMWELFLHHWGHFGMLDHGYTNLTAFHLGCYDEHGRIIIYKEYTSTKTLVKDNAKAIQAIIHELELESRLDYIVADPSIQNVNGITGSSIQNEYAENGCYLVLGNNDVRAGISRMNAMLKTKTLLVTDDNENLLRELPQYRWAKYSSSKLQQRRNPQEMPVKKNDHSLDAVRYGIMSRPQLMTPIPTPVGNVLNASSAIANSEERVDDMLTAGYKQWDNPEVFDDILGSDW